MDADIINQHEKVLLALMEGHRMDLVIAEAKAILSLDPNNKIATYCLMAAYNNSMHYDELYDVGKHALTQFADEAWVHHLMHYYYLYLGDEHYLKAKEHIEKAIELEPEEASYYRHLGEIYLINREPAKALKNLKKAVELNPDEPEYRSRMAVALVRTGKVKEALNAADKSLKDSPDDKRILDTAGMVYLLSGNLEKGEELFRDALRRFPTYGYFQRHLEWVLREKKDKESREKQGKRYTPQYIRQKDRKKFFDEDK